MQNQDTSQTGYTNSAHRRPEYKCWAVPIHYSVQSVGSYNKHVSVFFLTTLYTSTDQQAGTNFLHLITLTVSYGHSQFLPFLQVSPTFPRLLLSSGNDCQWFWSNNSGTAEQSDPEQNSNPDTIIRPAGQLQVAAIRISQSYVVMSAVRNAQQYPSLDFIIRSKFNRNCVKNEYITCTVPRLVRNVTGVHSLPQTPRSYGICIIKLQII